MDNVRPPRERTEQFTRSLGRSHSFDECIRRVSKLLPFRCFRYPVFRFFQPMLRFLFGKRSALTGHDFQIIKLGLFGVMGYFPVAQYILRVINANLQSCDLTRP